MSIELKTYISPLLSSNAYSLKTNNRLIIIDPYISTNLLDYIENNLLTIDYIILTHEHYDHISGVNWLKDKYNTKVVCSDECGKAIQNPLLNFSKYFDILLDLMPKDSGQTKPENTEVYTCFPDITFADKLIIYWMGNKIELIQTPGHSKGSICILVNERCLFSGDSLLKNYPTVTRLKGGSLKDYNMITLEYFKSLADDIKVFPGHYNGFILYERLKDKRFE